MIENKKLEKEKNFISIVIYLKNVENKIEEFTQKIDSFFKDKFLFYEFVFVNDNSKDNTKERLKKISDSLTGNVVVIDLAYEHGIELAMLAGIDFAIGDFIFEFDTLDINYDLNEILNIYKKSMEGYDVVSASPNMKLNLSSRVFYKILSNVSNPKMELTTEVFRVISRRAINRILRNKEKFRYRKALYHYSGFNTYIYKYETINNLKIKDNLTIQEKINLSFELLMNFSNVGIKLAGSSLLIFVILTFLYLMQIGYSTLVLKEELVTINLGIIILLSGFSILFFILILLIKYLMIILNEVKDKPSYIYKTVDRLSRK